MPGDTNNVYDIFVRDRQEHTTTRVSVGAGGRQSDFDSQNPSISQDGRVVAFISRGDNSPAGGPFTDRLTGLTESAPPGLPTSLDASGRYLVFESNHDTVLGGMNTRLDVYVDDRDADGDGMPSHWETRYGLNPSSAEDANADADADGVTNVQEFQCNSIPTGVYKRYFAEGVANAFFATRVAVANPGNVTAGVALRLLGSTGAQTSRSLQVSGKSRKTFSLTSDLPEAQRRFSVDVGGEFPNSKNRTFGILVESAGPQIVVERSFYASPGGVTFAAGGTPNSRLSALNDRPSVWRPIKNDRVAGPYATPRGINRLLAAHRTSCDFCPVTRQIASSLAYIRKRMRAGR